MTLKHLYQNTFILGRVRLANITDIIKIKTIKDSKKLKIIWNYVLKCNLYLYFLIFKKSLISDKEIMISAEPRGWVTWYIFFKSSLGKV